MHDDDAAHPGRKEKDGIIPSHSYKEQFDCLPADMTLSYFFRKNEFSIGFLFIFLDGIDDFFFDFNFLLFLFNLPSERLVVSKNLRYISNLMCYSIETNRHDMVSNWASESNIM